MLVGASRRGRVEKDGGGGGGGVHRLCQLAPSPLFLQPLRVRIERKLETLRARWRGRGGGGDVGTLAKRPNWQGSELGTCGIFYF